MTQLKAIGNPATVQAVLKTNRPIVKDQMIVCGDVSMMVALADKHPDLFMLVDESSTATRVDTVQAQLERECCGGSSNKKLRKTQVSKLATK